MIIDYQEAQRLLGHMHPSSPARQASTLLHLGYALRTLPVPCRSLEAQRRSLHRGVLFCLLPGLALGTVVES